MQGIYQEENRRQTQLSIVVISLKNKHNKRSLFKVEDHKSRLDVIDSTEGDGES